MDLSIIIVSWNVGRFLSACLDSIKTNLDKLNVEVIVVDSHSTDDTLQMLYSRYPWVRVMAQRDNVGFTRGNNIGLAAAQGNYVMLLNPDTEVIDDALTQMVGYLDNHADVGIIGPHTLNTDGTTQSTRRRFPTLLTGLFESTWLQSFAPRRVLDRYYVRDMADDGVGDVDWVQGSALMTRRSIYDQTGGLDERYIMFSEEMDWCKRIRNMGWRTIYLGSARIIHHGGKSTEQVVASKHIYFQQSKLRYFLKFHGPFTAFILRLFLIVSYGQQLIMESIKGVLGLKRPIRGERVRIYWKVIRSLTGAQG